MLYFVSAHTTMCKILTIQGKAKAEDAVIFNTVVIVCPGFPSYCCDKAWTKLTWERDGHALKQKPRRNIAYWLFQLPSFVQPVGGTTHIGLDPPT